MTTPLLSVVIATHNERPQDLAATIASIGQSTWVEIVVVDDASKTHAPLPPYVKIIRNDHRLGVGASRHIGVEASSAPLTVLTDAHVLFINDWLKPLTDILNTDHRMLVCGQMDAISENARDFRDILGRYYGARMVIYNPAEPARWRILTAKWARERPGPVYTISAVMGACYGFHRQRFLDLGGLRFLKEFGGDEEALSLKWALSGGNIVLYKPFRIAHKFRSNRKIPYRVLLEKCIENSMALAKICCPEDVAAGLIKALEPGVETMRAKDAIRMRRDEIEAERAAFQNYVTVPWEQYVTRIAEIDSIG